MWSSFALQSFLDSWKISCLPNLHSSLSLSNSPLFVPVLSISDISFPSLKRKLTPLSSNEKEVHFSAPVSPNQYFLPERQISPGGLVINKGGFHLSILAPKTLHHYISAVWLFSLKFRVLFWNHHQKYLVFSLPWELGT